MDGVAWAMHRDSPAAPLHLVSLGLRFLFCLWYHRHYCWRFSKIVAFPDSSSLSFSWSLRALAVHCPLCPPPRSPRSSSSMAPMSEHSVPLTATLPGPSGQAGHPVAEVAQHGTGTT